ncbi:MAG: stage III sporulation protein AF [Syntrophomonadaceae bacterium]|jgi:stage III sporulation protein AF|nr:stage III sporulation protein AF [Syntrophomonadaceae bacterium]
MDLLVQMVKSIAVIVLLATFLEILLPATSVRPFVRLAIGLFVLVAILNPVVKLLQSGTDVKLDAWDLSWDEVQAEDALNQGEKLNQQIMEQSREAVKMKMEQQVEALAVLVPGVQGVKSELELDEQGGIDKILLVVESEEETVPDDSEGIRVFSEGPGYSPEEKKAIQEKLEKVVKNLYGVETGEIKVKFEGG